MTHESKRWVIDLFAGCGGLSLGLEEAGFSPLIVSELHDDALDTYKANRIDEFPHLNEEGFYFNNVKDLVEKFADKKQFDGFNRKLKKEGYGVKLGKGGNLDLLVGGPPCQGFSGIGHRRSYSVNKEDIRSNHLYQDMLILIKKCQPKIFLFENVRGLMSSRWTAQGEKGEIWRHIRKEYSTTLQNYYIGWHLVYAKEYGVPQNRPRVLMTGIRKDIGFKFPTDPAGWDEETGTYFSDLARAGGLLPTPDENDRPPSLVDLLGDLDGDYNPDDPKPTETYPHPAKTKIQKELRTLPGGKGVAKKGAPLTDQEYSKHGPTVKAKFLAMHEGDGKIPEEFKTKKFAQRLLPIEWDEKTGPTITATSLPDDYVHYSKPRTLTVREWARLQTFPDWYVFKGKRTTGGIRRAGNPRENIHDREVPKYTQIGNAVPVKLAFEVGKHFKTILEGHKN